MSIENIKKEYEEQDTASTAYPVYVMVQELICVGVMASGYSACCPYGDGETNTEYVYEGDSEISFKSEEDLDKYIKENPEYKKSEFDEISVGYIWHPVEFFLTRKGAEEYMKANKHNHGKLRTYVGHFERRNFEMRELLECIGFRTKD